MTVPNLVLATTTTTLASSLVLGLVVGGAVSLLVAPALFSERFQSVFRYVMARRAGVQPKGYIGSGWILLYGLSVAALAAPYPVALAVVDVLAPTEGTPEIAAAVLGAVVLAGLGWHLVMNVLPDRGVDWDQHGYDSRTRTAITAVAAWFAVALLAAGGGGFWALGVVLGI